MTTLNLPVNFSGDNLAEPYFTWSDDSALKFDINISSDSSFATSEVDVEEITGKSFDLANPTGTINSNTGLSYYNRYYWRVRQWDDGGGPYSWTDASNFVVVDVPAPLRPVITSPLNAAEATRPHTITWAVALFADNHRIQISEDGSFRNLVVNVLTSKTNQIVTLDYGKKYYLRIRGEGRGGFGEYSEDMYFTVEDAP